MLMFLTKTSLPPPSMNVAASELLVVLYLIPPCRIHDAWAETGETLNFNLISVSVALVRRYVADNHWMTNCLGMLGGRKWWSFLFLPIPHQPSPGHKTTPKWGIKPPGVDLCPLLKKIKPPLFGNKTNPPIKTTPFGMIKPPRGGFMPPKQQMTHHNKQKESEQCCHKSNAC